MSAFMRANTLPLRRPFEAILRQLFAVIIAMMHVAVATWLTQQRRHDLRFARARGKGNFRNCREWFCHDIPQGPVCKTDKLTLRNAV